MNPTRRLLTVGPLAAVALSQAGCATRTAFSSGLPADAQARIDAFNRRMGTRVPICQAGMGRSVDAVTAAAVSNAGGLGALGLTWTPEPVVQQQIAQLRALTTAPFAVNYVLAFEPKTLPVALDAGAPIVQFSWGIPDAGIVARVRSAKAKLGVQVSTLDGARRALDVGVDYLVCQGFEAGGHVQASASWLSTLPAIVAIAKTTPVVVAGGISNGAALRRALLAGASAGLVGTRFIACSEAPVHPVYKQRLIDANASDTVMTVCFNRGWANATHRVLRNATLTQWEAAGSPPVGARPGEEDVVAVTAGVQIKRYSFAGPMPTTTGMPGEMALYAGHSVDAIRSILPAAEIVSQMWKECLQDITT